MELWKSRVGKAGRLFFGELEGDGEVVGEAGEVWVFLTETDWGIVAARGHAGVGFDVYGVFVERVFAGFLGDSF